ncbi:MAG: hypothetical protein ACXWBN_05825 [Acidimicrobiales bacterium]
MSVTVAAYGSLEAASADWDEIARFPAAEFNLIDAALIEKCDHRVAALHRCSATGWAEGSVASALVGMLSPPALLDGAIAGGVGRHVLTFVFAGLSRDAANELGRVLESGRFVTLTVIERSPQPRMIAYGGRALAVATLPMGGTAFELHRAVEADEADV